MIAHKEESFRSLFTKIDCLIDQQIFALDVDTLTNCMQHLQAEDQVITLLGSYWWILAWGLSSIDQVQQFEFSKYKTFFLLKLRLLCWTITNTVRNQSNLNIATYRTDKQFY